MATQYNNKDNIDSENDCNDNKRGKIIPELLKYPRYNANATSDNDDDSEDKDAECPVLINIYESDSDNEKEDNKEDQTLMEDIKKSMNMISRFLSGRKHSIFIDSINEDDHTDDEDDINITNSNIDSTS